MAERSSDSVRRAVRQQLESLQAAGVRQLPKAKPGARLAPVAAGPSAPATPRAASAQAESDRPNILLPCDDDAGVRGVVSSAPTLEILRQEVAACTLCTELAATRTQTVFGVGNPQARLCFLGEAPGADEDRLGEPFVGRGGQLLNKIIEACGLRREDVYILNILRCRPPGNRNPLPEEAANCSRHLERQLELVGPEYICCLGAVAAQNLLGTAEPIGKLRGRVHRRGDYNVVCTYHPAYLLRNPSAKKYAWDDIKLLMREMGTPVD